MLVNINGNLMQEEYIKINIASQGLLYGKGLFETILVKNGSPVFIKEHLERLF